MEIGPITGIRALSLLDVPKVNADPLPTFEVESSARAGDETYSSNGEDPDRGLEAEDSDFDGDNESEPEALSLLNAPGAKIDYFA